MAPPLYSIVDWNKHFENSRSRAYEHLHWIPIPNRHDGGGFSALACQPDASDLLAGWILIVQVASKMPVRGVLADKNGPLTADDLSVRTRFKAKIFTRCFEFLTNPKVRWLLCEQSAVSALSASKQGAVSLVPLNRTEQKGIEQNEQSIVSGKPKRVKFDAKTQPVPNWLKEHWDRWCNHRVEIKHAITPTQAESLVKKLEKWGPDRTIAAIEFSIDSGYQGLIEPRENVTSAKVTENSSADLAWGIIVKRLHGTPLEEGETLNDPKIQSAIKAMGGSKYLEGLDTNQLPYVKKDFIAAYNQASKQ